MNPQEPDPSLNLDDEALAQGRFTHTPIVIRNQYSKAIKAGATPIPEVQASPTDFDSGLYNPNDGGNPQISIDLGPGGTHESTSQISNHEQIHALMGGQNPPIVFNDIKPYVNWFGSGRGGTPGNEIPAYMGSYMNGQIKNIAPSDAKEFQEKILAKLPPAKAATFRRIIAAQEANKKFWEGGKE